MADRQGSFFPSIDINPTGTAVSASVWTLPVIAPGFIWLQFFSPLPVFYYLYESGYSKGINTLIAALILSGCIAAATGTLSMLVFSAVLLPAGYSMARSLAMGGSPARTGLNGFITLLFGWFLWSLIHGLTNQVSLYQEILTSVDGSLEAAAQVIINNSELTDEYTEQLRQSFGNLRELLPGIMPGLLITTMLNSVFCNLLIGQWLLRRFSNAGIAWPPFSEWRLPDQLVVAIITAGVLVLLPAGPIKLVGLNVLLVTGALYLFQGLAVLATLLNKWSVPGALKALIYVLIIVQAYGVIMVAILGIADIWVDFGKEKPGSAPEDNEQ